MKIIFSILFLTLFCGNIQSQIIDQESVILNLEKEWTNLLDKNDTTALKKIWTEDYVVNNATGKIVGVKDILSLLAAGHKFPKVERNVEKITFNGDLAVVMGSEIQYDDNGGKKNRRFTNVWKKTKKGWRMIARQANGC